MHATFTLPRIIAAYCCVVAALLCFTFGWSFTKLKLDISKIKVGNKPTNVAANIEWFNGLAIIFCCLIAVILAIWEFLLIFSPIKFKWYSYAIIRSFGFLFLGFLVLGVAGDLGIACCPFSLLAGLVNAVVCTLIWCQLLIIDDNKSHMTSTTAELNPVETQI